MEKLVEQRCLTDFHRCIYFAAGVQQQGVGGEGGKITLGQQLLFCAQGLAGVASKGKQPPPPILADLSKQWLVTRADTGALGQTHPSPIQTHDEISLVLDHHRINSLHHV